MIDPQARPVLARKVRLRFDRHTGRQLLVYPERGMVLNDSAAAIAALCTGEHSVAAIVERLHALGGGATREQVAEDVASFLNELAKRALVHFVCVPEGRQP